MIAARPTEVVSPARRVLGSRALRASARRLSWGVADQAVSSLTNFAVGIYVARSLGLAELGIFTLAWVTYAVVLAISRGLGTDPLVVRFSAVPEQSWRDAVPRAAGAALLVGIVTGVGALLVGAVIGGPIGAAFVALGWVLPAVLLQDSWRWAFFAAGRGQQAFSNDLVWAIALIPAMVLAALVGSVGSFIVAWGLAGGVAALYGCWQVRTIPHPRTARKWIRGHLDLGPRYLIENVSQSGSSLIQQYGLGAIAGIASVGTMRGAQLLMGPFIMVMMGIGLFAVPEAARVLRRSRRRLVHFCLLLGTTLATGCMVWGFGLLLLLPDPAGRAVMGDVWDSASALIVPVTLMVMAGSMQDGAVAGLRALGASSRSMRAQIITGGASVAFGLVGAVMAGALGMAWGLVIGRVLGAGVWWWELTAALRDEASPAGETGSGDTAVEYETSMGESVTEAPRLTIGLPVYNGQNYLRQSLEALLGQSYRDFELVISDNASTDETREICLSYAAMDPRIRYIRQPRNIGAVPNQNFVLDQARGEYFKWAAHDDLYGRDLLARCVAALDEHRDAILSHADMAVVDENSALVESYRYTMATDSDSAPERFRSLLVGDCGDDEYGVMRTAVLRQVTPCGSYHHPGRPFMAELALRGRFVHVRELLYFRRDHPDRGDRRPTIKAVCAYMDPRRASHSTLRLVAEYVWAYFATVVRAPIPWSQRWKCFGYLVRWMLSRGGRRIAGTGDVLVHSRQDTTPAARSTAVVHAVVPGLQRRTS